jgi:Mrp family chromosome partitioning ATPase
VLNGRPLGAVLWRRRATALLVVVLVAAGTVAWLLLAPRSYTATASLTATPDSTLGASRGTTAQLQATVAALANSRPVVADAMSIAGHRRSVAVLQDETWAETVDGTAIIRVHVEDRDRHYAARAADAIAQALRSHDPTDGHLRIAVAEPARVPTTFSSPDVAAAVVLGALLAVLAGLAATLVREAVAGRVDGSRQLAALARIPVLASVARPGDPGETPADASLDAEFRALRVGLEFATSDDPASLVVVAPAVPDDAAAWTTVTLALALAQVEHRVLLIDADLSATQRHPVFKGKGPGLAEVLRGSVELREAVRPSALSGVSVLSAGNLGGAVAANLIELRFHRAIAQLDKEVDIILIHAAALSESDDARVMAAGNALLVTVPTGRVRARLLRDLATQWERMRLRVVGAVLLTDRRKRRA